MLTKSFMHDLAKKYGGYLVHSEHRYYGESKATKCVFNHNNKLK